MKVLNALVLLSCLVDTTESRCLIDFVCTFLFDSLKYISLIYREMAFIESIQLTALLGNSLYPTNVAISYIYKIFRSLKITRLHSRVL